jgi:hypothetical protein
VLVVNVDRIVGWFCAGAFAIACVIPTGCASNGNGGIERPNFVDVPARGQSYAEVLVKSRIADEETVRATCYWKNREAGVRVERGAPGCSFMENGVRVILWTDPRSFTNSVGLEIAGHELYHHHNRIDHK